MTISTPDWVQDAIFYQIFPDRFARSERVPRKGMHFESWDSPPTTYGFKGGDLFGVLEHLDYLQDLGITAIYFNPIFASAANHRYHTYDYYNVDPLLGGNEALRALLDEAHRRGIHIVLDGVFNHASRGFWQFHHVLENGADSPYMDWFHFDPDRLHGKRNFAAYPSPQELEALHRGDSSLKAIGYQAWWNLPALPKFNTKTPAVRQFLFDVAEYWIRFGIDGWRLDVPAEIDDDSFWQEFRRRVRAINPQTYIVGEIWHEAQRWLKGDQFDAVMNYPVTLAALGYFGGKRLDVEEANRAGGYQGRVRPLDAAEFARQIDHVLSLYDPAITQAQLNLLGSHDTPRFLTCVRGDRVALRLAMLFLFTYPGAPCIYYGDEIGMDGRHDPDCRRTFPWDERRWDHELRNYTKECIALRKAHPALRRGCYHRLFAAHGVYAFGRRLDEQALIVVFNADEREQGVDVTLAPLGSSGHAEVGASSEQFQIILGKAAEVAQEGARIRMKLHPRSGVVLKR